MYTSKLLLHTNGCNIIFILILKEVSIQMSVRNAGKAIQEARKKAGLTQEQLSDGICSVLSLSRIENCSAGVSPSTCRVPVLNVRHILYLQIVPILTVSTH